MDGVTAIFMGEERFFQMKIGQLRVLEDRFDKGHILILREILAGTHRIHYVVEVIRLGLIGGAMCPNEANVLVSKIGEYPAITFQGLAALILDNAIYGGNLTKKPEGEAKETIKTSHTESTSQTSMASEQS